MATLSVAAATSVAMARKVFPFFAICSGQRSHASMRKGDSERKGKDGAYGRDWGICLAPEYYLLAQWWRANDARGYQRRFATPAAAEHARRQLEELGWPNELTGRGICEPV